MTHDPALIPLITIDVDSQDRIVNLRIDGEAQCIVSAAHRNRWQRFVCSKNDEYFVMNCEPGSHLAELMPMFIEAPPDANGMPINDADKRTTQETT